MNMTVLIFMICYVLLAVIFSFAINDFINPLIFFVIPLFLSYILFFFAFSPIIMVSDLSIITFLLGVTSFIFGFLFCFFIITKQKRSILKATIKTTENKDEKRNWVFIYLSLLIGVIGFIYNLNYFQQLGGGQILGAGRAIREAYIDIAQEAPFMVTYGKYFLLFSTSILWYDFLLGKSRNNKFFIYLLLFLCIASAFLTMSRTDLLFTLLPILVLFIRAQKTNSANKILSIRNSFVRKLKIFLIVFLSLMLIVFIGSLRTMSSGKRLSILDPDNYITQYIGYPLVAFDKWIVNQPGSGSGVQFLEPLDKILHSLHLIRDDNLILAQTGQFNVYGFLKEPYLDYGLLGVIFILLLMGIFCAWIYIKSYSSSEKYMIFYAFYLYGIFMSFFSWSFSLITFLYLFVFLFFATSIETQLWKSKPKQSKLQYSPKIIELSEAKEDGKI